jgi:hypothetical protein
VDTEKLAALDGLDCPVMQAVDFWVNTTLEGYIIEFELRITNISDEQRQFLRKTQGEVC